MSPEPASSKTLFRPISDLFQVPFFNFKASPSISQIDAVMQAVILIAVGLTPLLFSQRATELFEFPKMILIYGLALIAITLIISKWLFQKHITFIHSALTWPILIFILWLILTSLTSLNLYTSIAGYYSRFNGGLASYLAYIILGYATLEQLVIDNQKQRLATTKTSQIAGAESEFHTQDPKPETRPAPFLMQLLWSWLLSAAITSIWAILEHFGHDPSCIILRGTFTANCWVEDVQARVFSTFGQPNWLATYLVATLPIGLYLVLTSSTKRLKAITSLATLCCYAAFWYTYSRSGWFGLITALVVLTFCVSWQAVWSQRRWLLAIVIGCLIISATSFNAAALRAESSLSGYGSDTSTGSIRLLVWQGSLQLIQHHPWLGTGLGTFAYSFLPYRPAAMNNTTEWNFLYNEAHNQVLNTAATIGLPGLLIWLSLFAAAAICLWKQDIFINVHKFMKVVSSQLSVIGYRSPTQQPITNNALLLGALAAGIAGVFVSQLFGFDVVITNLLLFISLVVIILPTAKLKIVPLNNRYLYPTVIVALFILIPIAYLLFNYTTAELLIKQADGQTAINNQNIHTYRIAIQRNPWEPNYRLKLAAAYINSTTRANQTTHYHQADQQLKIARQLNPHDLVTAKSLSYYYRAMATVDPNYQASALQLTQETFALAPTDAESCQRLADLQLSLHHPDQALALYNQLIQLRPQADSYLDRATYFQQYGPANRFQDDVQSALKLDPHNTKARQMLEQK